MGRRNNNSSMFEDLFGIAAALPWWVGVILAAVAYVVLHRYAIAEVSTTPVAGHVGQMVVAQMVKTFSYYLQYILPVVFLAGAGTSYFQRKKRESLVYSVATDKAGNVLADMTWRDFELLVGEAFRLRGFVVTETGGGGADGGVDLMLRRGNELFLVQCKQWRALKVSVSTVRELYGVMAARGAAGGFVVTSGTFTQDAKSFAEGRNMELIEGRVLVNMIEQARAARQSNPVVSVRAAAPGTQLMPTANADGTAPTCPRCGGTMVKRIAKQGANAGNPFWGCTSFPACRGIRAA